MSIMNKLCNKKWLYIATLTLNIALWSSLATLHFTNPKRIPYKKQVESELENLVVNTSNKIRTVVRKSELEGIKDLQSLSVNADYEEAWIYIPSNSTWIEVGLSKYKWIKLQPLSISISDYSDVLFKLYSDIVDYHIHPLRDYEVKKMVKREYIKTHEQARKLLEIKKTIPSKKDLIHMANLCKEFYSENPEGNISFKIASPLGITEYNFTEKGKEFLFNDKDDPVEIKIRYSSKQLDDPINTIHNVMEQANKQGIVKFSFLPYDRIQ